MMNPSPFTQSVFGTPQPMIGFQQGMNQPMVNSQFVSQPVTSNPALNQPITNHPSLNQPIANTFSSPVSPQTIPAASQGLYV